MEFKRFSELLEVGHATAKEMLGDWARLGKLPTGTEGEISHEQFLKRSKRVRRNSI